MQPPTPADDDRSLFDEVNFSDGAEWSIKRRNVSPYHTHIIHHLVTTNFTPYIAFDSSVSGYSDPTTRLEHYSYHS